MGNDENFLLSAIVIYKPKTINKLLWQNKILKTMSAS